MSDDGRTQSFQWQNLPVPAANVIGLAVGVVLRYALQDLVLTAHWLWVAAGLGLLIGGI